MGKCKDCKWWIEGQHDSPLGEVAGVCHLTVSNYNEAEHPETNALAYGFGDEPAMLYTRPGFGCVQFEGKEA